MGGNRARLNRENLGPECSVLGRSGIGRMLRYENPLRDHGREFSWKMTLNRASICLMEAEERKSSHLRCRFSRKLVGDKKIGWRVPDC